MSADERNAVDHALNKNDELCGHCGEIALGYARLADGTRVCHSDLRSCYNDTTYRRIPLGKSADK